MRDKKITLLISFTISLAIHSLIFAYLFLSISYKPVFQQQKKEKTTYISFVTDSKSSKKYEKSNKKAKKIWLSKRRQRVKKLQTQRSVLNKKSGMRPYLSPEKSFKALRKKPPLKKRGKKVALRRKQLKRSSFKKESSLSNYIKNIPQGEMSVLNTDPLKFYSFFKRAGGKIRPQWLRHLQNIPMDFFFTNATEKTTIAQIVLDSKGRFLSVIIKKSSGISVIDEAATLALKKATPLPNPPKDLIQTDNLIYLTYSFHILWQN